MISSLQGTLAAVGPAWVHIVVGGVGFRVEVPGAFAGRLNGSIDQQVSLHTHLVVREDALTLYGFETDADRDGFGVLLSVSGIGPKLALAAIDVVGLNGLRLAIANEDLKELSRIPGVGKKTAQRMVLEIGEKLGAPQQVPGEDVAKVDVGSADAAVRESVQAALEQLGWPAAVAQRAVDRVEGEHLTTETMLRAALATLGNEAGRGF